MDELECYLRPATKRFIRANNQWVEVPVNANYDRREQLPNPGYSRLEQTPTFGGLPTRVNMILFDSLMRHKTPLMMVSKRDADLHRAGPAVLADNTRLEQELDVLKRQRDEAGGRFTRGMAARLSALREQYNANGEQVEDCEQVMRRNYTLVDFPLFYVSRAVRLNALRVFLRVNELGVRPQVGRWRHYEWPRTDSEMPLQFSDRGMTSTVLDEAQHLHVVIHWSCIPVLLDLLRYRGGASRVSPFSLLSLRITLIGKIHNSRELRGYMNILTCHKAPNLRITWSQGLE